MALGALKSEGVTKVSDITNANPQTLRGRTVNGATTPTNAIVIGAGMVGLATAWHLQKRGVAVTVLDRQGVAAGSSWGNAGWISPALTMPIAEPSVLAYGAKALLSSTSPIYVPLRPNRDLLRFLVGFTRHCTPAKWTETMSVFTVLNRLSLEAYDELADGSMKVFTKPASPFIAGFSTRAARDILVKEFEHVAKLGGSVDYDIVSGAQLRELEPLLADGATDGILIQGQRFIDPPAFVNSLADAVRARGGEIITDAEVTDVKDKQRNGATVKCADGRAWAADAVVIATGTWLGKLARQFGVKEVVQAGRGYSFSVTTRTPARRPIYFPAQRVACTPLGGRLRVSGMMEFRPASAPLDQRRIEAIVNAAKPMFDGVDWDSREDEWVGSRPCTADGLPLIGGTNAAGVYVAGGHGMWGIALGPLTGRLLADEIVGAPHPEILNRFDPLR